MPVFYQASNFCETDQYLSPGGMGGQEEFGCVIIKFTWFPPPERLSRVLMNPRVDRQLSMVPLHSFQGKNDTRSVPAENVVFPLKSFRSLDIFNVHFFSAFSRNVCCYSLPRDNSCKNCGRYEKTKSTNCSNVLNCWGKMEWKITFPYRPWWLNRHCCVHLYNDHSTIICLQNLLGNCQLSHKIPKNKKKQNRRCSVEPDH